MRTQPHKESMHSTPEFQPGCRVAGYLVTGSGPSWREYSTPPHMCMHTYSHLLIHIWAALIPWYLDKLCPTVVVKIRHILYGCFSVFGDATELSFKVPLKPNTFFSKISRKRRWDSLGHFLHTETPPSLWMYFWNLRKPSPYPHQALCTPNLHFSFETFSTSSSRLTQSSWTAERSPWRGLCRVTLGPWLSFEM